MKQYVILGHSSISKKNLENLKMTPFPNRMKLVMPAKCGQSITSNKLHRAVYYNKETAKMFARGENVRNRVYALLGGNTNEYLQRIKKRHNLATRGLERSILTKNYFNQTITFRPTSIGNGDPMHFGVYKIRGKKGPRLNILSNKNFSNRSLIPVPRAGKLQMKLSEIFKVIKNNVGAKNKNITVFGHFCRALNNYNKPNFVGGRYEVGRGSRMEHLPKNSVKRVVSLRKTPHALGLSSRRHVIQGAQEMFEKLRNATTRNEERVTLKRRRL